MPKPLGVVHILVSRKPPEHRLPQHADKGAPAVLAGAGVSERLARHRNEIKPVAKFTAGEQTCLRGDDRAVKLEHHPAVKIEREKALARFTRQVRHYSRLKISLTC